jgi:hypothetical protein
LGVIDVGSSTVSANTFNEVEILKAGADIADESFVYFTSGHYRLRWLWRRGVWLAAFTLEEHISVGAIAGKGCQIVGGIRRADVTESSNEVISSRADTSLALVYLISSTDRVSLDVGIADSIAHVVAENADTLAEDVVVYLINWAVDGDWFGASGRRDISGIGYISSSGSVGSDCRDGGRGA